MNTYKITFTRENGTQGTDHFTAPTERQARKDFSEVYRHGNGVIVSVELIRTDAPVTKQLLHVDGEDVVALNAAAVMTKLLQIANGSVYSADGNVVRLHRAKLEALLEIVDTTDSPVLVFYSYKHDLAAIQEAIPEAKTLNGPADIAAWNAGKVQVLLVHPASVGYGLNLQEGGHVIVWYGLTWSLELYQQANARLYRQGQEKPVIIHHLIAEGTVDEQVMTALERKDTSQAALLAALKERRAQ